MPPAAASVTIHGPSTRGARVELKSFDFSALAPPILPSMQQQRRRESLLWRFGGRRCPRWTPGGTAPSSCEDACTDGTRPALTIYRTAVHVSVNPPRTAGVLLPL